jgi:glucan biosynthesis protein C
MDALRGFMMLLGVLFHAAHVFALKTPNFIKDGQTSTFFDGLIMIIHSFRMPVFFAVAGFFTKLVLDFKGPEVMIRHRVNRILVPFLFSYFIICPLIEMLVAQLGGLLSVGLAMDILTRTFALRLSTYHFWFIYFLFLYCLGYYLIWKSGWQGIRKLESALSQFFRKFSGTPWVILLAGSVWSALFILRGHRAMIDYSPALLPSIPVLMVYASYFFTGIILFLVRDEHALLFRNWRLYLSVAALTGWGYLMAMNNLAVAASPVPVWLIASLLNSLMAWLMLFGCMGLFGNFFSVRSKTVMFLSDSAYWVYIIHHPVILILAGLMGPVWMPLPVKYLVVVLLTFLIGFLTYQYLVRDRVIGHVLNGRKIYIDKPLPSPTPQGFPG